MLYRLKDFAELENIMIPVFRDIAIYILIYRHERRFPEFLFQHLRRAP